VEQTHQDTKAEQQLKPGKPDRGKRYNHLGEKPELPERQDKAAGISAAPSGSLLGDDADRWTGD
jgi:hypothetical protein